MSRLDLARNANGWETFPVSEAGRDADLDAADLKDWLIRRRKEEGLTVEGLAGYLGVDRKTLTTAFAKSKGFPNGLTTYQLISEFGGVALAGPASGPTLSQRVRRIELMLEQLLSRTQLAAVDVLMAREDLGKAADG